MRSTAADVLAAPSERDGGATAWKEIPVEITVPCCVSGYLVLVLEAMERERRPWWHRLSYSTSWPLSRLGWRRYRWEDCSREAAYLAHAGVSAARDRAEHPTDEGAIRSISIKVWSGQRHVWHEALVRADLPEEAEKVSGSTPFVVVDKHDASGQEDETLPDEQYPDLWERVDTRPDPSGA